MLLCYKQPGQLGVWKYPTVSISTSSLLLSPERFPLLSLFFAELVNPLCSWKTFSQMFLCVSIPAAVLCHFTACDPAVSLFLHDDPISSGILTRILIYPRPTFPLNASDLQTSYYLIENTTSKCWLNSGGPCDFVDHVYVCVTSCVWDVRQILRVYFCKAWLFLFDRCVSKS